MMTLSEVAYKAAEYMAGHGYCKGRTKDPMTGEVCLGGAVVYGTNFGIRMYLDSDSLPLRLLRELDKFTEREFGMSYTGWNDREETTAEDAVLLLKRLARELEERGR